METAKRNASELQAELDTMGVKITATCTARPLAKHIINGCSHGKRFYRTREGAPWEETAFHWNVTIEHGGKKLETQFKCGFGWAERKLVANHERVIEHPTAPSSADVLSSLLLDGEACDQTFEDWCGNYGYDTDSRKALDTYLACQQAGAKVCTLFGDEATRERLRGLSH